VVRPLFQLATELPAAVLKPTDRWKQLLDERRHEAVIVIGSFAVPAGAGGIDSP